MKRPSETKMLPCKLTHLELDEKSQLLALTVDQLEEIERAKKAAADAYKESEKNVTAHQRQLATQIETGNEFRAVKCTWDPDMNSKQWHLHRDDTGEVIHSVTMTSEELQTSLLS